MPKDTKGEIYAGQPGGRHLEQRATAGGKKKKKTPLDLHVGRPQLSRHAKRTRTRDCTEISTQSRCRLHNTAETVNRTPLLKADK